MPDHFRDAASAGRSNPSCHSMRSCSPSIRSASAACISRSRPGIARMRFNSRSLACHLASRAYGSRDSDSMCGHSMQKSAVGRKLAHSLSGAKRKGRPVSQGSGKGGAAKAKGYAASGTIAADRKRRASKLSPCTDGRNWELHYQGLHRCCWRRAALELGSASQAGRLNCGIYDHGIAQSARTAHAIDANKMVQVIHAPDLGSLIMAGIITRSRRLPPLVVAPQQSYLPCSSWARRCRGGMTAIWSASAQSR
jgi:hypothetical protein